VNYLAKIRNTSEIIESEHHDEVKAEDKTEEKKTEAAH
jgi:hypothetical protein